MMTALSGVSNSLFVIADQKNQNGAPRFQTGDILTADVVSAQDGVLTLQTEDGFTFTAGRGAITGDVGDTLRFEVTRLGKDGVKLRQLLPQTRTEALFGAQTQEALSTRALFKEQGMLADEKDAAKARLQEYNETLAAIAAIKLKLARGQRVDKSAVQALLAMGVSLEKMTFSGLSDVTSQMDAAKRRSLSEDERQAASRLAEKLNGLSDGDISAFLRGGKAITVKNVYTARFSAGRLSDSPMDDETHAALKPDINRFFEREGLEPNEQNREAARFLLAEGLNLTKENLEACALLRNLDAALKDEAAFTRNVARLLRVGQNLDDANLFDLLQLGADDTGLLEKYDALLAALPGLNPADADRLLGIGEDVSLHNLRRAEELAAANAKTTPFSEREALAAKRRLAEIQLKLTAEAAARLANTGVDIDTMPLIDALEAVKAAEAALKQETYANSLTLMGAEASQSNVNAMTALYNAMSAMRPLTNNVFGDVLNHVRPFTIDGVAEAAAAARAAAGYEAFQTVADPKYGDSFAKVRGLFGELLESLNLPATDQNVKAAAILSKNQMDVTEASLEAVKAIDAKLQAIQSRLHPAIAASIIKSGKDPRHMHVDDVIAAIDEFDGAYGEDVRERIAGHILEMDKQNDLSETERAAMLAVYRMLHAATKDGGAAVGRALKDGGALTLGNLMEEAKLYAALKRNPNALDVSVDEAFGGLEQLKTPENNINAIFDALRQSREASGLLALKQMAAAGHPRALQAFLAEAKDLEAVAVEDAAAKLAAINETVAEESAAKTEAAFATLRELFGAKASAVHWMTQAGLPVTAASVIALSNLRKDPFFIGKALNDAAEAAEEGELDDALLDGELSALKGGKDPDALLAVLDERLAALAEDAADPALMRRFLLAQNAVKVQNGLRESGQDGTIRLGVKLNGRVAGLNVYIINEPFARQEESRVLISLNTENLGNIQFLARLSAEGAELTAASDDPEAAPFLEAAKDELATLLDEAGIPLKGVRFGSQSPENRLDALMLPTPRGGIYAKA